MNSRQLPFLIVLSFFILFYSNPGKAQSDEIKKLEDNLRNVYGIEKLKTLNELTEAYHTKHYRKSVRYGRQAVIIGENLFKELNQIPSRSDAKHLIRAYFQIGEIAFENEHYIESWRNLDSAKNLSIRIDNSEFLARTNFYLDRLEEKKDLGLIKDNFLNKTLGNISMKEMLSETSLEVSIAGELNNARFAENKGKFRAAIEHYNKAINLLKNKGDAERIREVRLKVAILYDSLQEFSNAREVLTEALEDEKQLDTINGNSDSKSETEIIDLGTVVLQNPEEEKLDSLRFERDNLKALSESFAAEKDFEKSLEYYKRYLELTQKVKTDSTEQVQIRKKREAEILLLKQQKEIADLNMLASEQEKEKQIRLRNTFIAAALVILLSALIAIYFYLTKRKEHKKLQVAYEDLDKTKSKLQKAEKRIVKLLSQQVSPDIAKELITNTTDTSAKRRFVCIMFLDIRDFTPTAEKLSPEELIDYQNKVFGFMIDIVLKHHGTINQLLGDGFMATFGAPESHGNDCMNAYKASKQILKELDTRNEKNSFTKTNIGIGLHAGNVVTGNVGNDERKQYSVTGNPVIIASRVEQLNKTYKSRLIMTEEVTNELNRQSFDKQEFIEVKVKGRSKAVRIMPIS